MKDTCNVCDDIGLVGHCKVFLGGYLDHYFGSGDEGEGRREWRAENIQSDVEKKQQVKADERLLTVSSTKHKYRTSMDHYPASNSALIETLKLQKHPEGGYFVETDRQPAYVPSPFAGEREIVNTGLVSFKMT